MSLMTNIAGYKFIALDDLEALKAHYLKVCQGLNLKGTIVFSPEGINLMLAGADDAIKNFTAVLQKDKRFNDLDFHLTYSDALPFRRMLVKIKPMLVPGAADPISEKASAVSPQQLKSWLQGNKEVVLLDTRNDYETAAGAFKDAVKLNIHEFKALPQALSQMQAALENKTIVMYCTGGIRCEKAAPIAKKLGFKNVYQLEGGILNYFKHCGHEYYQGDCYVFDERRTLTSELKASS